MITTVDKGWSWVILIAVFFTSILTFGFLQCLGVFFVDWQEDFGASAQAVGWSSSVFIAGFGLSGLISSFVSAYVSCRQQSLFGGVVAAVSLSCSYWITNITHLYIIMAISGFGAGCPFTNGIIVLSFYFKKKLALASGLALCGSGAGLIILAPLIRYLNDEYSWRGAMTICGALLANTCVFTALFRMTASEKTSMAGLRPSPDMHDDVALKKDTKDINLRKHDTNGTQDIANNACSSLPTQTSRPLTKRRLSVAQHVRRQSTAFVKPYTSELSIRLLMSCVISGMIAGFSYMSALMYFVNNAISLGVPKTDAAFLLSIFGIGSCIGRIGYGPIIDKKILSPSQMGSIALGIGGTSCLVGSLARTYVALVVFVSMLGLTLPLYNILYPLILKDIARDGHFKKMWGIAMILYQTAGLISLPIMGHIYDTTEKYAISFYIAGGLMILNSIINIMDPVWQSLDRRRLENQHPKQISVII